MPPTKTINVRRMSGERVPVEVRDAQHYEVTVEGSEDREAYWREILVVADDARSAKRIVPLEEGESVESARKLTLGEVAVLTLNGWKVAA